MRDRVELDDVEAVLRIEVIECQLERGSRGGDRWSLHRAGGIDDEDRFLRQTRAAGDRRRHDHHQSVIFLREQRRLRLVAKVGLPNELEVAVAGHVAVERDRVMRAPEGGRSHLVIGAVDAAQRETGIEIDGQVDAILT